MATRFLVPLGLVLLASCTVQVDSQYGIRMAPVPQRGQHSVPATQQAYFAEERELDLADHGLSLSARHPNGAALATSLPASPRVLAAAASTNPQRGKVAGWSLESVGEREAGNEAAALWPSKKKPPRNMKIAWILWAVPVVGLLGLGGGLLLNFGAHWYYLGKLRRARFYTAVWSLTVALLLARWVLRTIGLKLLGGILIIPLILLAALQIYMLFKDFFLLRDFAKRKGIFGIRNPFIKT